VGGGDDGRWLRETGALRRRRVALNGAKASTAGVGKNAHAGGLALARIWYWRSGFALIDGRMRMRHDHTNERPDLPRLLDAGDGGLVVELGSAISEATNRQVIALGDALGRLALPGIIEIVPTYRSLLVLFDPLALPRATLRDEVHRLWPPGVTDSERSGHWCVPVLYGGEHGMDLEGVARTHGLAPEEVVALHSGAEYRVYMIGFAPGFAYLGGLPETIHTSRRTDPRLKTPPRSISIGGQQTAISPPLEIPSGWHLLGQTPVRTYDPRRVEKPFLFAAGDVIRFMPITPDDYRDMCAAAEAGAEVALWEAA
jgi:KipI family sensor histidine kinase inhibitor